LLCRLRKRLKPGETLQVAAVMVLSRRTCGRVPAAGEAATQGLDRLLWLRPDRRRIAVLDFSPDFNPDFTPGLLPDFQSA
jgi:hypothetical protein